MDFRLTGEQVVVVDSATRLAERASTRDGKPLTERTGGTR
jgi:hypothetical protein